MVKAMSKQMGAKVISDYLQVLMGRPLVERGSLETP